MLKNYSDKLKSLEEKRNAIGEKASKTNDIEELRNLNEQLTNLNKEISETRQDIEDCERLKKQSEENKGIDRIGEIRMLTRDNITKLYNSETKLDLGKYIRGCITGDWRNAEAEEREYRSLSTTTGQVLIPKSLSADILQQVMNKSLIYNSGVKVADMPNGNLTIAKVKSNPEYGFKAELESVEPQDAAFEGVDLKGKMVYGLLQVSLEELHSAANLEDVLKQAMSNAIADAIDKACLYGTGQSEVKGIFNYDDINTLTAEATDYKAFVNAIGAIRKKNGEPTIMGVNADIDTKLNLLTNNVGDPLQMPKVVEGLNRVISNQLKTEETNGADAIVYDPNALIIGQQVQLKLEVSRDMGFKDGSVYFRIYSLIDVAAVRPEFVTRIKGLK